MSASFSLSNANPCTITIASPTTLKSAGDVGPIPSSQSGAQAAVEKVVAFPDERGNEQAGGENTHDHRLV